MPLFDGKTLAGWHGDPAVFSARDGMIVGRTRGVESDTFLAADREYGDFELKLRFQLVDGKGNSGVQFRSDWNGGHVRGYQADIGEDRWGLWWGMLYEERGRGMLARPDPAAVKARIDPVGWNTYEISAVGRRVVLRLNGLETARFDDPEPHPKGVIALQVHSNFDMEVRFRDIVIREVR